MDFPPLHIALIHRFIDDTSSIITETGYLILVFIIIFIIILLSCFNFVISFIQCTALVFRSSIHHL